MLSRFFSRLVVSRLLGLVVTLAIAGTGQAQPISTSAIYRNDNIGVRGAFAPAWDIITTREQAPDILKPNFPQGKGPDDSPLFIGVHENQQVFLRLLTETYFDDLEAYAAVLTQAVTSQGLEITGARLAEDNSALALDYRHPQLGLRFRERVALLGDSQVVRMAAWTSAASWEAFSAAIEDAFGSVELRDAANAPAGWQAVWENLDDRLDPENMPGVRVVQPAVSRQMLSCPDPSATMLWQVQSPALTSSGSEVYLFGSIHVGKPDFYPLPESIEAVFEGADYLVFEVDPTAVDDPQVIMNMQTQGMLPPGQTLADVVSQEVITDFRRLMGSIGLPAENFMTMQPWLVTLMLTSLQMNALGYQPEYGLENYFLSRKPANTGILELESIQEQIGFLQALNAETYLAFTIKSYADSNDEIENLIAAWQCADKDPLTDMLFEEFDDADLTPVQKADMDNLMDALYTQRNTGMAETIAGYADASPGRYFVVVGSAHLLGDGSVVELLRERGFAVNPVRLEDR